MPLTLVEQDTIKSVLQNIGIILTTPKGSVPHRPDFAVDYFGLLDNPTPLSTGRLKALIVEAIETYEPRAKVKRIKVSYPQAGHISITLTLEVEGEELSWTYSL